MGSRAQITRTTSWYQWDIIPKYPVEAESKSPEQLRGTNGKLFPNILWKQSPNHQNNFVVPMGNYSQISCGSRVQITRTTSWYQWEIIPKYPVEAEPKSPEQLRGTNGTLFPNILWKQRTNHQNNFVVPMGHYSQISCGSRVQITRTTSWYQWEISPKYPVEAESKSPEQLRGTNGKLFPNILWKQSPNHQNNFVVPMGNYSQISRGSRVQITRTTSWYQWEIIPKYPVEAESKSPEQLRGTNGKLFPNILWKQSPNHQNNFVVPMGNYSKKSYIYCIMVMPMVIQCYPMVIILLQFIQTIFFQIWNQTIQRFCGTQ